MKENQKLTFETSGEEFRETRNSPLKPVVKNEGKQTRNSPLKPVVRNEGKPETHH